MKAILKEPGKEPVLTEIGETKADLHKAVGGDYETVPALFGAMALCRGADEGPDFNCHFMGRYYYGNVLIVGRGLGDQPTDVPEHLRKILLMALREAKR